MVSTHVVCVGAVTHGAGPYSMEFRPLDSGMTGEEWLQLVHCTMLNSQFLVSRDGAPAVRVEFRGHVMSKARVVSNDKQGSRVADATLVSVPEDRGMQS